MRQSPAFTPYMRLFRFFQCKIGKENAGFTLIELLIVIGILGLVSIGIFGAYAKSRDTQQLVATAEQFGDMLRRAHIFSRELKEEKMWGVTSSGSTTQYSLASVQGTQPGVLEQTVTLPGSVQFSAPFDIWFDRGTGDISAATGITLKNVHNRQMYISISPAGTVEVIAQ